MSDDADDALLDKIIARMEEGTVCALCEGDKRILSFSGGIYTVACWLCEGTGERKLPAVRVAFLLRVLKQRAGVQ